MLLQRVPMEFLSLTTVEETLDKLATYGSDAALIAGGTHARYMLMSGQTQAKAILHIERLEALGGYALNGSARLGALTNMRQIAENEDIRVRFNSLAIAAGKCGGWQTQSVATIGGNVCAASPSADLLPPLLVLETEIELHSQVRGSRSLSLSDFITGAYQSARAPDEMATAFHLPLPAPRSANRYIKIQRRSAMERPIIGLALSLEMDDSQSHIKTIRIALSGGGPMAFRAVEAEGLLTGQAPETEVLHAAAEAISARCTFRDDARASATYRAAVLPRAFSHAVSECLAAISDNGS